MIILNSMRHKPTLLVSCLIVSFGFSESVRADSFVIARNEKPASTIVLGSAATWQDRFAARELTDYVARMTDAKLPTLTVAEAQTQKPKNLILIGTTASHELLGRLSESGKIKVDPKELTSEGFVLKTVETDGQACLAIAGASNVSTVYAAYDLLERFGRIGFFRYEEHVPRRQDFVVPECDIRERPHFRTRMHGGQYHYFGIHWFGEEQWKENIRWCAKRRINRQNYIPGPPVQYLAEKGAWEKLGVKTAPATEPRDKKPGDALAMVGRLSRYGAQLGLRAPLPTTDGQLPPAIAEEFRKKHPTVKYLTISRNDATSTYVDPSDPMWLELNKALLENGIEHFGNTQLYNLPSPWGERSPGDTPEDKERLTRDYASALGRMAAWAHEKYPDAQWMMDCWTFANKEYWQPYRVKRMLDSLPQNLDLVLWDYPAQEEPSYVYNSYWFGRPWAYLVCQSMAGNTTVHGDAQRLMGETFRVLCDQRANKLVGFGNYTEANDYTPFFKDLINRMAWNPMITLDDFVLDYCQRRYSAKSVPAMVACHQKLLKTVYGPQSDTHMTDGFRTVRLQDPVYWFALGENWVPFDDLQWRIMTLRKHWGPILLDALEDALSAANQEKENKAYVRDLTDIMRSYVHVRMNEAICEIGRAVRERDKETFAKENARVQRLFDALLQAINLVSDRWEFGVNALIDDFADAPLRYSPEEIRHYLHYVTWSGDKIYDYSRADRYESIRDVYRPMTEAYLEECRKYLEEDRGKSPVQAGAATEAQSKSIMDAIPDKNRAQLSPKNKAIIVTFVKNSCPPPPAPPDAVDTTRRFLQAARQGDL